MLAREKWNDVIKRLEHTLAAETALIPCTGIAAVYSLITVDAGQLSTDNSGHFSGAEVYGLSNWPRG